MKAWLSDCRICGKDFEQAEPKYRICLTCHLVLFVKQFPDSGLFRKAERPNIERIVVAAETLDQIEQRAILGAVRIANGDFTAAARLLGIGRTTLYRKMREYGLGAKVAAA